MYARSVWMMIGWIQLTLCRMSFHRRALFREAVWGENSVGVSLCLFFGKTFEIKLFSHRFGSLALAAETRCPWRVGSSDIFSSPLFNNGWRIVPSRRLLPDCRTSAFHQTNKVRWQIRRAFSQKREKGKRFELIKAPHSKEVLKIHCTDLKRHKQLTKERKSESLLELF